MATLEQLHVLLQIDQAVMGMARNMRRNAQDYIDAANRGQDPAQLGVTMKADANQFLAHFDRVTQAATRNITIVTAALGIIGTTPAVVNTTKNGLVSTCNHVVAAQLTTKQQVLDEANFILGDVPAFEGLF